MSTQLESIPPPLSVAERTRGAHVLYVDDEEALVFLATRALERFGYRVSGFSNALRALKRFVDRPTDFDAIVTDLTMSAMSGLDLVREIRKARTDVPIVLTSGYVGSEDARVAAELGISEIVIKPQAPREICRLLERLIQGSRHAREEQP